MTSPGRSMADFHSYLAILDSDPDDAAALAGLMGVAPNAAADPSAPGAFAQVRKNARDRGRPDVVVKLLDVELTGVARDKGRRADLLLEKAQLLEDELLDEPAAVA